MAQAYGWSARRVESELTDELLLLYLDSAADRLAAAHETSFVESVEASRMGVIFAHNGKAHGSWLRRRKAKEGRGLVGEALERAVGAIAATHSEYVVVGAR